MSENTESSVGGTGIGTGQTDDRVFRPASTSQHEPVSLRVVEALAEANGVSPMELDQPLYDSVDPEALDTLFDPTAASEHGRVVFTVGEHEVTVTADQDIYVRGLE